MNTYHLTTVGSLLGCILLSACQQNIPAPVVIAPAPQLPQPVVTPTPKAQPKKETPKPKKKVTPPKEEDDLVPVLPLRPNEVGNRTSILP
jgi:hypothetical protein